MSSNPMALFNNLFGSAAGFNNAQYSPYGGTQSFNPDGTFTQPKKTFFGNILNMMSPAVDFLSGAYQAHAANPQAGGTALAGLINAYEGGARRNYMKQMQQQAQNTFNYQYYKDKLAAQDYAGAYYHNTGKTISGYGDGDKINPLTEGIRENNQNPYYEDYLKGKALRIDPHGKINPEILKAELEQRGKAVNFLNQNAGLDAIEGGQEQSVVGNALKQILMNNPMPNMTRALNQPVLADINGNPVNAPELNDTTTLNANASYSAPGKTLDPDISGFAYPTDIPAQIAGAQQAGLKDKQEGGQQEINQDNVDTTRQHYQNVDTNDKRELDLKDKGNYYKNYPPAGGSGRSPWTDINGEQNYYQGQIKAIDDQLKSEGFIGKSGVLNPPSEPKADWFGNAPNPVAVQKYQRYQQLMQARQQISSKVGIPQIQAVMQNAGNNGVQNINNAGVAAKYGVRLD